MSETTTTTPGQTFTLVESGIPSGSPVGYQIIKAASGTVSQARTNVGVIERPAGSGAFVITGTAPIESDLFMVVIDWTGGVLDEMTTRVQELRVVATAAAGDDPSGLGVIADWTRVYLGGETFQGLIDAQNYGSPYVVRAITAVKARVMTDPPATDAEGQLPTLVADYFGKLVALELIPAARDYWGSQYQTVATGNDPVEVATYPSRMAMLDSLQDDLLRQVRADAPNVIPLVDNARLRLASTGPDIDEDDLAIRVTEDPRTFPPYFDFPHHHIPGTPRRRESGQVAI